MNPVENFIYEKTGNQQAILMQLHQILAQELGLRNNIRWSVPFYYQHSRICYLNPKKKDAVELVFTRGQLLSNEQELLQTKGRKQMSGITIESLETMPLEAIYEVIQEALVLDEQLA